MKFKNLSKLLNTCKALEGYNCKIKGVPKSITLLFYTQNKSCSQVLHGCNYSRCYTSVAMPSSRERVFKVLPSQIDQDNEFEMNLKFSQNIINKYTSLELQAKAGGGEKAILRHTQKQKKLLATERLKLLLDDENDFLELSLTAGLGMEYGDVPRAGMITGIGKIHGRLCMVIANDATVKGGTIYPVSLKKQLRAQEIAEQNKLPTIYVVESGGAFLPLQSEIFLPGGRSFYNEAVMSSQGIPQIAVVCGNCTAGGAYVPTMADEAVIVHKQGYIFLGGPPLVQAATGEIISAEELGGAKLHCNVSGCTDYFASTETEALNTSRDIVATLTSHSSVTDQADEPLYDAEEILGLLSSDNTIDIYKVIARIVDGSRFHEFKKTFGSTLVTGFAHIQGCLVGIVGNHGEMTEHAADKGSHFVLMCNERDIPIIFLQNTSEKSTDGDIQQGENIGNKLRAHSKMISAVSCSSVPKITFIIGNGIGPVNYFMGGRAVSPNFLFSWPNAVLGLADTDTITDSICQMKMQSGATTSDEKSALEEQVKKRCQTEMSAFHAASRIWTDGIVLPQNTRQVIGQCLDIVFAYRGKPTSTTPVIRM